MIGTDNHAEERQTRKETAEPRVAVVVPLYKEDLSHHEVISLTRCHSVLGRYPIVYVAPASLRLDEYKKYGEAHVERFPDRNFKSVKSYSKMMLTPVFYERFLDFEFILIYQLDAFVFEDKLSDFCKGGWDYIGAPWLAGGMLHPWHFKRCERVFKVIPWINKPRRYFVGNGGLSLRRVDATIRVLRRHRLNASITFLNEDLFFASRADCKGETLRVAPIEVAIKFAFEEQPDECVARNGGKLPFGCHAWDKFALNYVVDAGKSRE